MRDPVFFEKLFEELPPNTPDFVAHDDAFSLVRLTGWMMMDAETRRGVLQAYARGETPLGPMPWLVWCWILSVMHGDTAANPMQSTEARAVSRLHVN